MKRCAMIGCLALAGMVLAVTCGCGEAHSHIWTEATCITPKTCSECGATEGDPLGHSLNDKVIVTEQTCAVDGVVEGTCTRCGETVTEVLPATGDHQVSTWTTTTQATCTEPGSEEGVCDVCGETLTRAISMIPHADDGIWVVTKAATESASGTKVTHCSVCGEEVQSEKYELTQEEKQALRSAKSYLSFMAFSRKGLIDQLEFEGFSRDAATMAVDSLDVDWNEQAAKDAQSYLDFMAFSRSGLINQLMFEGYTREQAEYGATAVGL